VRVPGRLLESFWQPIGRLLPADVFVDSLEEGRVARASHIGAIAIRLTTLLFYDVCRLTAL